MDRRKVLALLAFSMSSGCMNKSDNTTTNKDTKNSTSPEPNEKGANDLEIVNNDDEEHKVDIIVKKEGDTKYRWKKTLEPKSRTTLKNIVKYGVYSLKYSLDGEEVKTRRWRAQSCYRYKIFVSKEAEIELDGRIC